MMADIHFKNIPVNPSKFPLAFHLIVCQISDPIFLYFQHHCSFQVVTAHPIPIFKVLANAIQFSDNLFCTTLVFRLFSLH